MTLDPRKFEPWLMFRVTGGGLSFNEYPAQEDMAFIQMKDMPAFLSTHRDQSLWLAIITGLNPDGDLAALTEVHRWILSQHDCDNVVAVAAWKWWRSHEWCGRPAGATGGTADRHAVIPVLIAKRDEANPFSTGALSDPSDLFDRSLLLAKATAEAAKLPGGGEPIASVPLRMLSCTPTGQTPTQGFVIEENAVGIVKRNLPLLERLRIR
ncbi:hypothetical protein [Pseudogemmobacter bohemicus]|uniref:hypothetical protein n=1 Tax=Pseudogemmobacter bohemicus TaxID=2250708 RepID=UPI000DD4B645|nr:hypothetical protein [Pseudogemmobacter bohemicus]